MPCTDLSHVIWAGLLCLLVIQAAAKSESVPVIAQEFTKLFTVVALTDLTNLTKC